MLNHSARFSSAFFRTRPFMRTPSSPPPSSSYTRCGGSPPFMLEFSSLSSSAVMLIRTTGVPPVSRCRMRYIATHHHASTNCSPLQRWPRRRC